MSAPRLAALIGGLDGRSARGPAYRQLADRIRRLIADGRVRVGTRLPSERGLTDALAVSRTTVARAYDELRHRGYLRSRRGSGSVATLPGGGVRPPAGPLGRVPGSAGVGSATDTGPATIDLTIAAPPAPAGVLAAYEQAIDELPHYLSGAGYYPAGLPGLRGAIAARFTARGLPTDAEQIVVTAGALAAVGLALRVVVDVGDRVALCSPNYPNTIAAIRDRGARTVPVDLEPDGFDLSAWAATLRQAAPRAAYLVPDFHNPTGLLMSTAQRQGLAAELRRTRTTGIVDESVVEVVLDDVAMPPPFAAAGGDLITVGGLSKAVWGGLRIGWLRAGRSRIASVITARLSADIGAPVLEQLVANRLLEADPQTGPIAAMRAQLRDSRAALLSALAAELPQWRVRRPAGGICLWCELPAAVSAALVTAAEAHGVLLASGSQFSVDGELERFVRLPYALPADELTEAVPRIAAAYAEIDPSKPARRRAIVA